MTSNRSLFNAQLLRETMRRNVWAVALSFVGFFFCLPLPMAMSIQRMLADPQMDSFQKQHTAEQISSLLSMNNGFIKAGICIMAVLCGIVLFSYLHSRKQVDFYHTLPLRRGALFVNNYVAGLLTVLPAFFIMYAVTAAIGAAWLPGTVTAMASIKALALHIVFFLCIYTVSVLATILTGNTILALLLDGWLMFSVSALAGVAHTLGEVFLKTWSGSNFLTWIGVHASPVILYMSMEENGNQFYTGAGAQQGTLLHTLIGTLVLTIVVLLLSFVLFNHRKSENAGVAVAFEKLKPFLKCYMVLTIALGFGLILLGIGGEFWIWFGLVLGAVLGHILLEIIYQFDIRAAFGKPRTMALLAVAAVLIVVGVQHDVIGYDKWLPRVDKVQAVGFRYRGSSDEIRWEGTGFWDLPDPVLSDTKTVEIIYDLAKQGVEEVKSGKLYGDNDYDGGIDISFKMKNGKQARRSYRIGAASEVLSRLNEIRFTEDYITKATPLFTLDLERPQEQLTLQVRANADPSAQVGAEIRAAAQTREIIETLRQETLTLTQEEATTTLPVLRIDALSEKEVRDGYTQYVSFIPVYPSYTRTLALLAQYGGIKPRALSVDDLKGINITRRYEDEMKDSATQQSADQMITVTDTQQMEMLLKNAVLGPVAESADRLLLLEEGTRYSVEVVYRNNQYERLFYHAGTFPEQACDAYFSK